MLRRSLFRPLFRPLSTFHFIMADDAKDRRKNECEKEFARDRQKEQFRDRDARLLRERATLADEAAKVSSRLNF